MVTAAPPTTRPATDTIPSLAPNTRARNQFDRAAPLACGSVGCVAAEPVWASGGRHSFLVGAHRFTAYSSPRTSTSNPRLGKVHMLQAQLCARFESFAFNSLGTLKTALSSSPCGPVPRCSLRAPAAVTLPG